MDAISTLSQNNPDLTDAAYNLLDETYDQLAKITEETETVDLLYAHCMYQYAKVERYWKYYDFEKLSLACLNVMLIAEHTYSLFEDPQQAPLEVWLIRNKHVLASYKSRKIIDRIGEAKPTCKCALCKAKEANKKNSHLIPSFLIKEIVNINPNKDRGYECVIEENDAMAETRLFFGQAIPEEEIDARLICKRIGAEKEIARYIPNPVTRNNLFCSECEDRFCGIETEYKKILLRVQNEWHNYQLSPRRKPFVPTLYNTKIPYLFWLSVVWRMSKGELGIKLPKEHENKIGDILNKCLVSKNKVNTENLLESDLCYFYTHEICHDLRGEPIGIFGSRNQCDPYVIAIGNHYVCFFTDEAVAKEMREKDLVAPLLNGSSREKCSEIPFITFWERMLWLRCENAIYNQKHLGECTVKDVFRYHGVVNSVGLSPAPYTSGDYFIMKGQFPFVIPWSLAPYIKRMQENPQITTEELAKNSIYSVQEMDFMRKAYAGRLKRILDELKSYYNSNKISGNPQLNLSYAEYDHDKFDFYRHWPVSL